MAKQNAHFMPQTAPPHARMAASTPHTATWWYNDKTAIKKGFPFRMLRARAPFEHFELSNVFDHRVNVTYGPYKRKLQAEYENEYGCGI